MDKYNSIQKKLVELCERPHYCGIRHPSLSGTICEDLLIGYLRDLISGLKFNRGVVSFADKNKRGVELKKEDFSTQQDIIVYRGQPIWYIERIAIVHISQVVCVIEVKKWTTPNALRLESKQGKKLARVKQQFDKYSVPSFYVTYRFHDRLHNGVSWESESKKFFIDNAYCFFGKYTAQGNRNRYPWEESGWNDFNTPCRGQFEKLVNDIKKLK
ncbi:hypothetical protein KAU09_04840 [Candidatus Parcubacteria bacterium]|nr:hypothetical protein [Candidatus Parcubacteria bacterium]